MPKGKPFTRAWAKQFAQVFESQGTKAVMASYGITERVLYKQRRLAEGLLARRLVVPRKQNGYIPRNHPERMEYEVEDGVVLVASDAHYWPGDNSTAHRALVKFAKEMKPKILVMNGDAFDGASISRHPPIGWTRLPTVQEELEAVEANLVELSLACPKSCKTVWTLGNHDARFETKIATCTPEMARVPGTSLVDHFPTWQPCWSVMINEGVGGVFIKHRFKGGMHAPHNNTLWGGRTVITGHLHSQKVQPITDLNGTRWGVDTGCLADPGGQQFVDYTEDNPTGWRSGFVVLTFWGGALLPPELATVWDEEHITFRGEVIRV